MDDSVPDEFRRALARLLGRCRKMGGGGWAEALEASRVLAQPAAEPNRRVRHKRRGSTYEVLGEAQVQVSTFEGGQPVPLGMVRSRMLREGDQLTVYRAPEDGRLFARFPEEFEDGRFEEVDRG